MGNLFELTRDHLEDLPPDQVAAWYFRLAQAIERNNTTVKDPLAPKLLKYWMTGKGNKFTFPAPDHLRQSDYVIDVLGDHRDWYLTEEKFKGRWVGVIPRLQGKPGFEKWSPWERPDFNSYFTYGYMYMNLQSLVEIPVKIFGSLSDGDFDLLTSLHGFQLRTDVRVSGYSYGTEMQLFFNEFLARASDRYDWDPDKHFTVPNPDYNNPFNVANPVAPSQDQIMVYHKNAIRVEKAGLAWPYDLESEPWRVTDMKIMGPAKIEMDKDI